MAMGAAKGSVAMLESRWSASSSCPQTTATAASTSSSTGRSYARPPPPTTPTRTAPRPTRSSSSSWRSAERSRGSARPASSYGWRRCASTCVASSATASQTACPSTDDLACPHPSLPRRRARRAPVRARSVCFCQERDLIAGTHLSIDAFHVEASAALQSLRASLALAPRPRTTTAARTVTILPSPPSRGCGHSSHSPSPVRGRLPAGAAQARRRSLRPIPTRSCEQSRASVRTSFTEGQVAVDPKARCIIACLGEQADGHEGDAAPASTSVRALTARGGLARVPTRALPPSASGRSLSPAASRSSSRPEEDAAQRR